MPTTGGKIAKDESRMQAPIQQRAKEVPPPPAPLGGLYRTSGHAPANTSPAISISRAWKLNTCDTKIEFIVVTCIALNYFYTSIFMFTKMQLKIHEVSNCPFFLALRTAKSISRRSDLSPTLRGFHIKPPFLLFLVEFLSNI